MPFQGKKTKGRPQKKNIRQTDDTDVSDSEHKSLRNKAIGNISVEQLDHTISHNQSKIWMWDDGLSEIPPRMTVDGTCAPRRLISIDGDGHVLIRTTRTMPSKYIHARMSTGGRAPPKIPSPPKDNLSSLKQKTSSTLSSPIVQKASPVRTAKGKPQGKPKNSVKRILIDLDVEVEKRQRRPTNSVERISTYAEVAVKKTRDQPRRVPRCVRSSPRKIPLSQPVDIPLVTAKRPLRRPRKSLAKGSVGEAGGLTRMKRGGTKVSVKRSSKTAAAKNVQSNVPSVAPASRVLLDHYSPEVVHSKETAKYFQRTPSVKQRRPVRLLRQSVSDSSLKNQGDKKSRTSTVRKTLRDSRRQIKANSQY